MQFGNLAIRLATAAVVSPLLLWLLFFGPVWGWYALIFVAALIASQEVLGMTHPKDWLSQVLGVACTASISLGCYYDREVPHLLISVCIVTTLLGTLLPLFRLVDIQAAGLRLMSGIATPFYVGGLLTTLALLRRDAGVEGPSYVLLALMFAWMADTGGYFFGRYLGKTKLYERVSPKKTRAGFVGSLLGAIFGGLLAHFWYLKSLPLGHAVLLGIVAGALGQLGDLAESLLKRSTGIKDSGWIIPGHGGMLDRVDALLLASPVLYLYVLWH